MELRQQFENVMGTAVNMALATSKDKQPNVRIVTFGYDKDRAGHVYFTTFKGNQKIKEFQENPNVSCMPLPLGPETDVQVRIFGKVQKAELSMDELIAIIARKFPGDAATIKDGGDMMEMYEVVFDKAYVTIGMNQAQELTL